MLFQTSCRSSLFSPLSYLSLAVFLLLLPCSHEGSVVYKEGSPFLCFLFPIKSFCHRASIWSLVNSYWIVYLAIKNFLYLFIITLLGQYPFCRAHLSLKSHKSSSATISLRVHTLILVPYSPSNQRGSPSSTHPSQALFFPGVVPHCLNWTVGRWGQLSPPIRGVHVLCLLISCRLQWLA